MIKINNLSINYIFDKTVTFMAEELKQTDGMQNKNENHLY